MESYCSTNIDRTQKSRMSQITNGNNKINTEKSKIAEAVDTHFCNVKRNEMSHDNNFNTHMRKINNNTHSVF